LPPLSERNVGEYIDGLLPLEGYEAALSSVRATLGPRWSVREARVGRAMVAIAANVPADKVASHLDWRDFEGFCAGLLAAKGFRVTEDLRLKKPRIQVDVLARSSGMSLLVDCKHWARERGPAALAKAAAMQSSRARAIRAQLGHLEPMAVVLLVLAPEQARFVDGAAVVPISTLGDFLDKLELYSQELAFY
jgi:Restriction endonuclease